MAEVKIKLDHRPALKSMQRLGGDAVGEGAPREGAELEARRQTPRIRPASYFDGREGFDPAFLGEFETPLPAPLGARARDVLSIPGHDDRLDYHHFSAVMSKARKVAMFVAVNIDGKQSKRVERTNDTWWLDGRISEEAQLGEDLYADNLLDRGHLVRREDPNWGSVKLAEAANDDTFHFTNCAPQMGAFNQRTWLGLEDYVLQNTRRWKERVTVFTGPFFGRGDLNYRSAKIPLAFWKVIAFISDDGTPSATAYTIDQERELGDLEAAFGKYKTYQRSVAYIEERADLDFGELRNYDGFSNEEAQEGVRVEAAINSLGDIRV